MPKPRKLLLRGWNMAPLHIMSCENLHDMWNKLKVVYDKESAVSIHLLQQNFFTAEFNQESMFNFLSKIEEIRVKLKQAGEEISDKMTITKILMSLPDQYKHFRSVWESAPVDKQTLEKLISRLLLEEERANSNEVSTALTD
ncbi:uncharacterized protein LOC143894376 [Temnothorax americanus]|uniref:uncharacterized protein LOC143894376 n=1 Tax=Temnothorax americanus TaxID=1964332 RepID=UPI004068EF2F